MEKFFKDATHKTRVLVLSTQPVLADFLIKILHFSGKEIDFLLSNHQCTNNGNDFAVIECDDITKGAKFEPNIVLISSEITEENLAELLENVVAGGVVIYPNTFEATIENHTNFFRRLAYSLHPVTKEQHTVFDSPLGPIPFHDTPAPIVSNINGLQLLTQQFGIMEQEFFEICVEIG